MSKISINNFSEGMIPDADKSIRSKNSYNLAENLRYIANEYANSGALHSVESSDAITTGHLNNDDRIIGHQKVRDNLILFLTRWINSSTRTDTILKFDITESGLTNNLVMWTGSNLYSDTAGATADDMPEYLSTVGRYEDSDNIKVYWANSEKPIRVANVAGGALSLPTDQERFNLITNIDVDSLRLSDIQDGNLYIGKYDYGYSLIKENGQETIISSGLATGLIPLYSDPLEATHTVDTRGDLTSVNSNKSIVLDVTVSSDDASFFDKLRLYRIHYKEYAQVPEITIVKDYNILSGTNTFVDNGSSDLGTITVEEYAVLSNVQYTSYVIEEKDNYLFAGNLEENIFDVSVDTRAYAFNEDQEARLYSDYENYHNPEHTIDATSFSYATPGSWPSISDTANCVNPHNDINNDLADEGQATAVGTTVLTDGGASWTTNQFIGFKLYNRSNGNSDIIVSNTSTTITTTSNLVWAIGNDYQIISEYFYQANGSTPGGEGPYVKYSFAFNTSQIDIDDNSSTYTDAKVYSGEPSSTLIKTDYVSPVTVSKYAWFQRDEIYRVGLIFYNKYGQQTPVKWIADIRFPGPHMSTSHSFGSDVIDIVDASDASIAYATFSLKDSFANIDANITGWRLVRAVREENDRTIISSGLACPMVNDSVNNRTRRYHVPDYAVGAVHTHNYSIFCYNDVDSLFFKNTKIRAGDYVDFVGTYTNYVTEVGTGTYPSETSGNYFNTVKYRTLTLFDNTDTKYRRTIDNLDFIESSNVVKEIDYSSAPVAVNILTTTDTNKPSVSGSMITFQTDSATPSTLYSAVNYYVPYVYIKRNNINRYGGYKYIDRLNTKYIFTSAISTTTFEELSGGDTYINYLDYLWTIRNDTMIYDGVELSIAEATSPATFSIFPIESKINLSLRADDHYAKIKENLNISFLQETAGLHTFWTKDYEQDTNLYLYNSVYSQERSIDFKFADPDIDLRTRFDSRIAHSDKKFDDEYIDSWTRFRPNNFLDLESKHGPIKSLNKHNNTLYFTQDDAFGALSVNQRSLISDNNPGQLSLGSGSTLDRYDYINEYYGSQHKKSITANKGGIFFFDKNKRSFLKFGNNSFEVLSDSKGFRTVLKDETIIEIPFVEGSDKNNEVYWQFGSSNILVFNIFTDTFVSNYTFSPAYIGDVESYTMHRNDNTSGDIYGLYTEENSYGSFDNESTFQDSKIQLTNNEDFFNTKVYDNLIFFTNSKLNDIERNTDKFDTVSFWNDYQYTGVKTLTLGTTLRRRERGYSTDIPRNIVNANGTTNIDIFDAGNHNSSRTFKERMRDKYIAAELIYQNSATKGQLSVPYIGFKYKISTR